MVELRPYQKEAVSAVYSEWEAGRSRTVLAMATGCGKTSVAGDIARREVEAGRGLLMIAHRDELIRQAAARLESMCGMPVGIEKASERYDGTTPLCAGSVQTLQGRRLDEFPMQAFPVVVVDEAHHSVAGSYRAVLDRAHASGARILGVTATPDRADKRGLAECYDSIAYEYRIERAVKEGYLCPIRAKLVPLSLDISEVAVSHGDFQAGDLGTALDPYIGKIAETMAVECKGRKTVVFCPLVSTSEKVADALNAAGLSAVSVSGYDAADERKAKLSAFEAGDYDVLCNSMLLCLDDRTEILTARGFVGIDEMRVDDLVANWNFDGSVFFEKPHEIVRRPLGIDEHMTSIESKTINLRVTNTHRMIVKYSSGNDSKWRKIPAEGLRSGQKLPSCGVASPLPVNMPEPPYERLTHLRVESGELGYTHPSDLSLDECRFIGFFLAEGTITSLQSGGTEYKVCQVSDKYPAIVEWFDSVVDACGFNCVRKERWRENPGRNVTYWSFCRGTGHGSQRRNGLFRIEPYLDHDGTDLFWGLDEEQFDALIEGFWYGDGFHGSAENGMPRSVYLSGCYKSLFDLWCAIGSVRGWRCSMFTVPQKNPNYSTQYRLHLIKGRYLHISCKTEVTQEEYRPEEVWCVRTTSKNIITRRNGKVTVMGNTEGWDCPSVDCVVVLRPTKSRPLYMQMLGRGTRLYPDKDHLLVLDFLWMTERHDLCRPATLLGRAPEVSERAQELLEERAKGGSDASVDIMELSDEAEGDVQRQREEALAKQLKALRHRKKKLVDPLQYAVSICDADLTDYRPAFAWESLPPTEAQLKRLESLQIDAEAVTTRGMASQLIDACVKRIDSKLCTPKQIRFLESRGFEHVGTWSKEQASCAIDRIAGNRWRVPYDMRPGAFERSEAFLSKAVA